MKTTDKLKARVRASWRQLLLSLLRITYRVQNGLEARLDKASGR
jgi:hypothetical protein